MPSKANAEVWESFGLFKLRFPRSRCFQECSGLIILRHFNWHVFHAHCLQVSVAFHTTWKWRRSRCASARSPWKKSARRSGGHWTRCKRWPWSAQNLWRKWFRTVPEAGIQEAPVATAWRGWTYRLTRTYGPCQWVRRRICTAIGSLAMTRQALRTTTKENPARLSRRSSTFYLVFITRISSQPTAWQLGMFIDDVLIFHMWVATLRINFNMIFWYGRV